MKEQSKYSYMSRDWDSHSQRKRNTSTTGRCLTFKIARGCVANASCSIICMVYKTLKKSGLSTFQLLEYENKAKWSDCTDWSKGFDWKVFAHCTTVKMVHSPDEIRFYKVVNVDQ